MYKDVRVLTKRTNYTRLVPAILLLAAGLAHAQTTTTTTTATPTISSLSPTTAVAGGAAVPLTINGTNFSANSQVYFGNNFLPSTLVSATQLTTSIPATVISQPYNPMVYVYNGRRTGGLSNGVQFQITPSSPPPTVTSLSTTSLVAGSPATTLTITGTNFVSGSQVYLGRNLLTTTFVSATQLTAALPAAALTSPGQFRVVVSNGLSSGFSTPMAFTVTPANAPTITTLSPTTVVAGAAAFTLTVNGTNFLSTSQAYLGNTPLATTFVSATQLTAIVPATSIAQTRNAVVFVYNGRRNGGSSNTIPFQITPSSPSPTVTTISPTTVQAGSAATTITITGTNFISGSQVFFGRMPLATTFGSATSLTAVIPAAALTNANQVPVVVSNGASSGYSIPVTFTITPPTAQVAYIINRRSGTSNAALYVAYQVVTGTMLDLTQPVTVTVGVPPTAGGTPVTIFTSGPITLAPATFTQRNGTSFTYYQFQTSTEIIYVVPQANNQYSVQFETLGVNLSAVNQTLPATVTLNIGGQALTAQAQPFLAGG
ncbi:MAG: IPT/TIG domain-containing protein [Armatimonadota bacterium]|nr:IPT/TIG domain-containing protein [Armatimonadota bacterium]